MKSEKITIYATFNKHLSSFNAKETIFAIVKPNIMAEKDRLHLYIIAGCNGAGKTTASFTVLPEMLNCREFVNADEIAKGLSPFNPEGVAIQAGRLMIDRIIHLLKDGETFAFETTLATRSYVNLIQRAQKRGYFVTLLFFSLSSPNRLLHALPSVSASADTTSPTMSSCAATKRACRISLSSTLPSATTGRSTTTPTSRARRLPMDGKTSA